MIKYLVVLILFSAPTLAQTSPPSCESQISESAISVTCTSQSESIPEITFILSQSTVNNSFDAYKFCQDHNADISAGLLDVLAYFGYIGFPKNIVPSVEAFWKEDLAASAKLSPQLAKTQLQWADVDNFVKQTFDQTGGDKEATFLAVKESVQSNPDLSSDDKKQVLAILDKFGSDLISTTVLIHQGAFQYRPTELASAYINGQISELPQLHTYCIKNKESVRNWLKQLQ